MTKRLLLTGAFGLVGSNICKIIECDYPEIEVTKVKCDDLSMLVAWDNKKVFDYIIHAAGYGQPQMFGKDKIKTIEINTDLTIRLFEMLKTDGKFLFISSSEVYSGAPSPHTEDMIGTTTPQHPRACYIEGKRCGEAICMAYKEQGYDVKIARLALAYGPGTKKGDTRVLNQFIEQALTTGEIRMRDDGAAQRIYLYVEDAAQIMLDLLFKGKSIVYNVVGSSRVNVKMLADNIAKITGAKVISGNSNHMDGSPLDVFPDFSKYLLEFPRKLIPLEEGLKKTIEYQKELYGIK